jgi:hypothetical protein
MLEAPGDPSEELITFHVKMLRKLKKSVSMDKWEKVLTRCHPLLNSVTALTCSDADPDPGSGAFLTPGSGIRDEPFRSYFRELRNNFLG